MRGATLELLDITYDGEEDSVTGVLSGGLGQLVSGGSPCSSLSYEGHRQCHSYDSYPGCVYHHHYHLCHRNKPSLVNELFRLMENTATMTSKLLEISAW